MLGRLKTLITGKKTIREQIAEKKQERDKLLSQDYDMNSSSCITIKDLKHGEELQRIIRELDLLYEKL